MPPKSARREFSFEVPTNTKARVNSRAVPGGKKSKKGKGLFSKIGNVADTVLPFLALGKNKKKAGKMDLNMVPDPHQIEMSGGSLINTGRGEIMETEQAIKPLMAGCGSCDKGAGLFGDIGQGIDDVTGLLGLGKKRGRKPKSKLSKSQQADMKELSKILGLGKGNGKKLEEIPEDVGAGLFGDIGQGIDSVTDLLGLGKKRGRKPKAKVAGADAHEVGAGLFGDIGQGIDSVTDLLGLGKKRGRKPKAKVAGADAHEVGAGLFGDIGQGIDSVTGLLGLGKKRGRKPKAKKAVANAHELGAGLFGQAHDFVLGLDKRGGIQGSQLPPTMTNPMQMNISENVGGRSKVQQSKKAKTAPHKRDTTTQGAHIQQKPVAHTIHKVGNKRGPTGWQQFVKAYQQKMGGTYGEALAGARPHWQKIKAGRA